MFDKYLLAGNLNFNFCNFVFYCVNYIIEFKEDINFYNTIMKALERMGFKGRMTGHGFRGLASTLLHEQGFDHHDLAPENRIPC